MPLLSVTLMLTSEAAPSRVTTCVFVRMYPSDESTTPEPVPPSLEAVTEMVTTLGDALAATAVTVVALLASLTVMFCGPETVLMVALLPVAE